MWFSASLYERPTGRGRRRKFFATPRLVAIGPNDTAGATHGEPRWSPLDNTGKWMGGEGGMHTNAIQIVPRPASSMAGLRAKNRGHRRIFKRGLRPGEIHGAEAHKVGVCSRRKSGCSATTFKHLPCSCCRGYPRGSNKSQRGPHTASYLKLAAAFALHSHPGRSTGANPRHSRIREGSGEKTQQSLASSNGQGGRRST